jgi:hypothetical protein
MGETAAADAASGPPVALTTTVSDAQLVVEVKAAHKSRQRGAR